MPAGNRILFLKFANSSFIVKDEKILATLPQFTSVDFTTPSKVRRAWLVLKYILYLTFNFRSKYIIVTHFANWVTGIIAMNNIITSNKLVIFNGGFDVNIVPEIGYGIHTQKGIRRTITDYSLRHADYLLPKSSTLIHHENSFSGTSWKEGIKHFVPDTKSIIKVIPNCYDYTFWQADPDISRDDSILTVGFVNNQKSYYRKGIDIIFKIAEHAPQLAFKIIGMDKALPDKMGVAVPSNITLIPAADKHKLKAQYQRSKIFCLFSRSEGMPNVLSEAMLCGCYPIASNVNGIPEVINDTGIVFDAIDIPKMAKAIRHALATIGEKEAQTCRDTIVERFPLERRANMILDVIKAIEQA